MLQDVNGPTRTSQSPSIGFNEHVRFQLAHEGFWSKGPGTGAGAASGGGAAIVFLDFRSRFRGCSTVRHPDLAGGGGSVGSGAGGAGSGGAVSNASGCS